MVKSRQWSRWAVGRGAVRSRCGFTLVELLVVISIIAVLIGLLLPAVLAAVEAGRRTRCVNNIKQICTAVQNLEGPMKTLPVNWGVCSTVGTPTTGFSASTVGQSWLTQILPEIEEAQVFDMIKTDQPLNFKQGNINNDFAAQRKINSFICPSDTHRGYVTNTYIPQPKGMQGYGGTNYKGCAGGNWQVNTFVSPATPVSTRGRNAGKTDGIDFGNGAICRGGGTKPGAGAMITRMADIRDGTSKTFLVGESIPDFNNWSAWYWFDAGTATCGIPLNWKKPGTKLGSNPTEWQHVYGFASRHRGGGNFGMCDGSQQFVNATVSFDVYRALASIQGEEKADLDE